MEEDHVEGITSTIARQQHADWRIELDCAVRPSGIPNAHPTV
jgi:hypothetical protein